MRNLNLGIDMGSTTIKLIAYENRKEVYKIYKRHFSDIKKSLYEIMIHLLDKFDDSRFKIAITGSAGVGISEVLDIPFTQEVIASTLAAKTYLGDIDTIIELGGEDAKIIFLKGGLEQRMNGTCAGGTGAFIDQMATLLKCTPDDLDKKSMNYNKIYPIAARCGVFAKSDIQPLINQGVCVEDLAVSIYQSVVNQTIAGLACGRKIKGNVAFLGGPLTFLKGLQNRFVETLGLTKNQAVFPANGEYFVAMGAALKSAQFNGITGEELKEKINTLNEFKGKEIITLKPLFNNEEEKMKFTQENIIPVKRGNINEYTGKVYLGIDAGSTTTKMAVVGEDNELLFERYGSNEGRPLEKVKEYLKDLYESMNGETYISSSVVTGYGEELIQKAFNIDKGIVETVAHYTGANFFYPGVSFILDIGGQDMKCMKIQEGVIQEIMLNEACSSGCGSFIQAFAESLKIPVDKFGELGTMSKRPVDLGSRCTVFMNSRVKQAQKEGAGVDDISAGLSYSVIKNALFKVIKLKQAKDMGDKIILQGGTFYNNSVFKAFSNVTGINGKRPEICGVMGAFGAAIFGKENNIEERSSIRTLEDIEKLEIKKRHHRCNACENKCAITVNIFDNGEKLIVGNRCEIGAGISNKIGKAPNLYKEKLDMFKKLNNTGENYRFSIGLPMGLNMFQNLPLWYNFFDKLKMKVIISDKSSKELFKKGFQSIPSESVCYPAKLMHGHVQDLIDKNVDFVFYPAVVYEKKEVKGANNHYNCPIVTSYPEVIKNNMDINEERLIMPFINLNHDESVIQNLFECFKKLGKKKKEIREAFNYAKKEYRDFQVRYRKRGESVLKEIESGKYEGIILAGRPYHLDEEINHGIPELINSLGFAVLSEECISHLGNVERPIRVVDQWAYHTRLYECAEIVGKTRGLNLIQLNSFGCGLDAVTTDMVQEIIQGYGKIYTCIKIDEINNLGAAKIRIRSLIHAIRSRRENEHRKYSGDYREVFTKEMRNTHTIIAPQMSPIHFDLIEEAFLSEGFKLKVLHKSTREDIEEGLKYVNNDACYPSIITVGQIMNEVKNGEIDIDNTAVIISQTGGGCRATNYIGFLRKALKDAGYSKIPVISMNAGGLEANPGFKLSLRLIRKAIMGLVIGDLFLKVLYRSRPYEVNKGECDKLHEELKKQAVKVVSNGRGSDFKEILQKIVDKFEKVKLKSINKPKVGVVGEILVKYHPLANNNLVDVIEKEGGEAVVPGLIEFFLYCSYNTKFKRKYLGGSIFKEVGGNIAISYIEGYVEQINKILKKSERFTPSISIEELAEGAEKILSLGNMTGEGWFLTAEMVELINSGVNNIVCTQPFACLPNHVTGKGMIKALKQNYPLSNIVAIDYDPGASEVNQINRIKLMMTTAFENMEIKKLYNEAAVTK